MMLRYLLCCILIIHASCVSAVSQIDVEAEQIEYDGKATLQDVRASLYLQQAVQVNVQAKHAHYDQIEAKDVQAQIHWRGQNPELQFSSNLKRNVDQSWAKAKIHCDVPRNPATELWHCRNGVVTADRIKLPFDVSFQPRTQGLTTDIHFKEASFSDETGLHAAEKLSGDLHLDLQQMTNAIRWQHVLNWTGGEVYWQPYYLVGQGHQSLGAGVIRDDTIRFENVKLDLKDVGALQLSGELRSSDKYLIRLDADLPHLNLATAYPLIFKPLLEKTAFNNAEIDGKVDLRLMIRDAEIKAFDLKLQNVNIEDKNKKFAFYKLNANIPWDYDTAQTVQLSYESGMLLNMPLGLTHLQAEVDRYAVTSPRLTIPILDGALQLNDVAAARIGVDWYWRLGAKLVSVSMVNFSQSLNLPRMEGNAAGEIPQVTYNQGILTTHGDITLNVFDGEVRVSNLEMIKPLSVDPQMIADLRMRNLDLGKLTRTFSFGAIEGKLDGDVSRLEMQNWKPIRFDASIYSSAGKYAKKISQRAVENISALGGAGAAAALQRSFLQFFKQFNYEKMGLSCKLRNDICQMDGVASTTQGYVIVKGSGIPAITVLGYNHQVGWAELLARVKRVIEGNAQAVIQ